MGSNRIVLFYFFFTLNKKSDKLYLGGFVVSSINDKIREYIFNTDSVMNSIENLYFTKMNEEILRLLLCDYYKVKYTEAIVNGKYEFMNDFKSINTLLARCKEDPQFLLNVLKSSYIFKTSDIIKKMIVFEELNQAYQDPMLMKITNLHILDKMSYTFVYDIDSFKDYYASYRDNNSTEVDNSLVVEYITSKLLDIKDMRNEELKNFVLEFLKDYYKFIYFIRNKFGENFLDLSDNIYYKLIRSNSLNKIIKFATNNYDFLYNTLYGYLFYSIELPDYEKELVNEYFFNNENNKMQKKLKMKK